MVEKLGNGVFPGSQVFHLHLELFFFDRLEEVTRCGFRHHVPERAALPEVIECGYHDDRAVLVGLAYVLEVIRESALGWPVLSRNRTACRPCRFGN